MNNIRHTFMFATSLIVLAIEVGCAAAPIPTPTQGPPTQPPLTATQLPSTPTLVLPTQPPPTATRLPATPTSVSFDIALTKANWRKRIEAIKTKGVMPVVDIESSFNSDKLNISQLAKQMDDYGVALIAYSDQPKTRRWSDAAFQVIQVDPQRFIPTSDAGIYPFWTQDPSEFLAQTKKHVLADNYPLMGEFEFRHYPSPLEFSSGAMYRDTTIPIKGSAGIDLFAFAEKTGIPFEIHYEIEDILLPPLEEMLRQYPKAKVIWCHLAQIRYANRSTIYSAAYVRKLIETYPNLYFDVAFGGPNSIYPGSGEYQARVWDRDRGRVKSEWAELIAQYPWRFLAALDLGADRQDDLPDKTSNLRKFLESLPAGVREIVSYKAAWKLLFGEEL